MEKKYSSHHDTKKYAWDFARERFGSKDDEITKVETLSLSRKDESKKDSGILNVKTKDQLSQVHESNIKEEPHILKPWYKLIERLTYRKKNNELTKIDENSFKRIVKIGSVFIEINDRTAYNRALYERGNNFGLEERFLKKHFKGISFAAATTALTIGVFTLYNRFKSSIDDHFQVKTPISYQIKELEDDLEGIVEDYKPREIEVVETKPIKVVETKPIKVVETKPIKVVETKPIKVVETKPREEIRKNGMYSVDFSRTSFRNGRIISTTESNKIMRFSEYHGTPYKGEGDELKLRINKDGTSYQIRSETKKARNYFVICYDTNGNFIGTKNGNISNEDVVQIPKETRYTDTMLLNEKGISIASHISYQNIVL
ncbi:hypothetical protein J4436_03775 [Candidatus Woesearchaeota archaeon]|nr:hypothetical protein [Candidatus Woesearchaeota archaeon]